MNEKANRASNRSHAPKSEQFLEFMGADWDQLPATDSANWKVAEFAKVRRQKLASKFQGKLIFIDAGAPKNRANDTYYRYRPETAFAHLTGWGWHTVPDSVLVIDARPENHEATLFMRPTAGKQTEEFFANPDIGEFWVGSRPTLDEISNQLGIETKDLAELDLFRAGFPSGYQIQLSDADLATEVSELRMVKDEYEITQMRAAVAATIAGFEDIVRELPQLKNHPRGERVIEGTFFKRARISGHDLGYETISASGAHACYLHWTKNNGATKAGDLVLIDAGVELDSLYTADITRTLPISGSYTDIQKEIYAAVLGAADAAFAIAKPGVRFRDVHQAAIAEIAKACEKWGFLPTSAEQSLEPDGQFHRRWMVHGTSHHLGMDVHDCAEARKEMYLDRELEPGMVFTIEPGLYFHQNDLKVPEQFRGIGIRIEDDVLVTEDGCENLSAALPRATDQIEAWMASLQL